MNGCDDDLGPTLIKAANKTTGAKWPGASEDEDL